MIHLYQPFISPTSHPPPGTHKTSDNKIHLKTTGSDDPVPGCGTRPDAGVCGHFLPPDGWSV